MNDEPLQDRRSKIGVTKIVEILLWTRRYPRTLVVCEREYGHMFYEAMRRGLVGITTSEAIVGRSEVARYIDITAKGYDFLRYFGPKEYR